MSVIPIVTITDPQSSSDTVSEMIRHIQVQKSSIHLGIRASMQILNALNESLHKQLSPFISSGRIRIYPDSLDLSFHGLMNVDALHNYIQKGFEAFHKAYPESSLIFIPRWHDVNRTEVEFLYKEFGTTLILTRDRTFFKVLSAETSELLLPCVIPHGSNPKQFCRNIETGIHKRILSIKKLMSHNRIHDEKDWDTIILINGDEDCQITMESLALLARKHYNLNSGVSGIQYLRSDSQSLFSFDFPYFDLPQFGPEFIAQLFPTGRKSRKLPLLSTMNPLPLPDHKNVEIPHERKLTSIMLGDSEFREKEFIVQFNRGNISSILQKYCQFHFSSGIGSEISIQKAEKIRNCSYSIENAFAIEGEDKFGLRQVLTAKQTGLRIAGRIINDFLLIDESQELYIDSYIQHPWLEDDYSYCSYIPQMLILSDIPSDKASITIRSQNFDSSERSISIQLDSITTQEIIFLPGRAWILDSASCTIGIDLVYAQKEKIHLPSAVIIKRLNKKKYQLSFLPTAIYTRPKVSTINGLMEHYTLRLKPNITEFDNFTRIGKKPLSYLEKPFIVYF